MAILQIILALLLAGCVDTDTAKQFARETLEGAGYREVVLTGYQPREQCGRNFEWAMRFEAVDVTHIANPIRVQGTVCHSRAENRTMFKTTPIK
jgi:hypothetical protein